ncbi:MAG: ATP-binding protein [Bacteroidales bacterium]|nr:ATP-binding protein [Bacteroidales bacterium]
MVNPFVIKSYESKEFFCDREEELQLMLQNCINKTDMTLVSRRRMGKTGLVFRLFDELNSTHPEIFTVYLDIFISRNLDDFIKLFAEAAVKAFPTKTKIGERLMSFIKSLRPQVTYDSITGEPQFQIAYHNESEKEYTLRSLFELLTSQNVHIVFAIDEFQQIREYPEQNMEAMLRTYMQRCNNVTFIFSGSRKHLMTDIFTNARKPFYSSTSFVSIDKISATNYSDFICKQFSAHKRKITDDAVNFILEWTQRHTYYTQFLCHTIYANGQKNIDIPEVKKACGQVLSQREPVYLQYRKMLTDKQWDFLIAVAKEGSVRQITAADFLKRYKIGGASVSKRLVESLCEKELLNAEVSLDGVEYSVDDVFFSRWLEAI